MGRYKTLTDDQRTAVEQLTLQGHSNGAMAGHLGISKWTVAKVAARVRRQGHAGRPHRPGRPPLLDDKACRRLGRLLRSARFASAADLTRQYNQGMNKPVSVSTVRRVIRALGVSSFKPMVKPFVGRANRIKRLKWARARQGWKDEWSSVLFTDESSFEVRGVDKHARVWRSRSERWLPDCLKPSFKSGRETVMVWGGFCAAGRTKLVRMEGGITGAKYADLLIGTVYSEIQVLFGSTDACLLQEDNAPPHAALVCRAARAELGMRTMAWPAQSPDLNPIENAWDYLDRAVRALVPVPRTKDELFAALSSAWDAIPDAYFARLVESMPRRMAAVKKTGGFPTKY